MPRSIHCILLVDDDPDDNFLHQLIIEESGFCDLIRIADSAHQALDYLKKTDAPQYVRPDLLVLDINMPGMNGFEFLEEYDQLDTSLKSNVVVLMLTTSLNPGDTQRAHLWENVKAYHAKPLTKKMIQELVDQYFS